MSERSKVKKRMSGRSTPRRKAASAVASTAAKPEEKAEQSGSSSSLFPVVGVGASAGGLAAVTELLKKLPHETGVAVVVIQHLDPNHGSFTTDILSRVSAMPVDEVKDGMEIQPDHVYVIPPNSNMRLTHGVLRLSPRTEIRGQHLPIDLFFQSLADDRKHQAIGVVLSGIASDGTRGIQAIKAEGGFTFAQDPTSAQYDGMPRSAILSGAVDIVETPEGIAREIAKVSSFSARSPASRAVEDAVPPRAPNGSLLRIFASIRNAKGVDFTHYKRSTIQRRIARRMFLLKIDDLETYAAHLGTHPEEVNALFADILIHVTGFFRDSEAYEALKTHILPKYMENWDPAVPFRVWVPGCSTGEEAYSVAMAFFEFLDTARARPALQIFASDISEPSIQKARSGIYPDGITRDVSKARLNRFFERTERGGYRIAKWIRDTCLFSKHDLTADPPFAKIDLISCRNVLIYFTAELQKRVVPILHYALNPGGILWLGHSETLGAVSNSFAIKDRTNKFYSKKVIATPLKLQFPVAQHMPELLSRKPLSSTSTLQDVQAEADRIAVQQYAPAGVVVNDTAEIVQVRGRPAPYVELAPGQANLNLFKLAHPAILSDLRFLMSSARQQNVAASRDGLSLKKNGRQHNFGIRVVPFCPTSQSKEQYFSIFFEDVPGFFEDVPGSSEPEPPPKVRRGRRLKKGKGRVEKTQQIQEREAYQRELIEEYETTQEELVSSNEELQSTNEELQSTNEELETAKEELQSANEEMTTINDELQARNSEMTQVSNDLTNLLASVDIPIVMVGPDARIRRFTPKAGQTLNLIPSDVGRSVGDIKPNVQVPDLTDVVAEVMASLSLMEVETQGKQGSWYRLQVRPYRTADHRIDGAVIALTDITVLKRAAEQLRIARDDARKIIEAMPTPILVISSDRRVQAANDSYSKLFKVEASETEGRFLAELCDGGWNIPALLGGLEAVLREGRPFHEFEVEQDFPRVGHKYLVLHATSTFLIGPGSNAALLAIEDLTVRKETADRLRHTEQNYRRLMENANDGIIVVGQNGVIEFANHSLEAMFGYAYGELQNKAFDTLVPDEYLAAYRDYSAKFQLQPESPDIGPGVDLLGKRKDGTVFPVEISLSPVRVNAELKTTAIVRDTSERKKIERERQELLVRETDARLSAERAGVIKDEFLATLSHELRTPLTTILTWTQMLQRGKLDPQETPHALAMIEKSARDQAALVGDLLDVSRIHAGKVFLELRDIEPRDCITAALESVRNAAETKSIALQCEFDPSSCWINADSDRLEQVFQNLLTNAVKFTPPGGKVTVRSKRTDDQERLQIQVEDTGRGIKPEFLPHLFTRFMQEDSSTKRGYGGLGLGLSIVRTLVDMHGGIVTASSPGEGKGAVFTVTLPCLRRPPVRPVSSSVQEAAEGTAEPADLDGLRVLVIDDLEETRQVFSTMLQSSGSRVETAATVESGLAALARFKPDVVLCDIAMPGEDGFGFIRKVRALKPGQGGKTAVIALTALTGVENTKRCLEEGFDAHLAKPVDVVDVSRLVTKLARRSNKQG